MIPYKITTFRVQLRLTDAPPRTIHSSADAVQVLRAIYTDLDADQEHACLLSLNHAHDIHGYKLLASGHMDATQVDFKLLFRAAFALEATAIILCHNHPSGRASPSPSDQRLTTKLRRASQLLDLSLLDHIILGHTTYYSFADSGLLHTAHPQSAS
jgi:DNA repair protein RadC